MFKMCFKHGSTFIMELFYKHELFNTEMFPGLSRIGRLFSHWAVATEAVAVASMISILHTKANQDL